MLAHPTLLNTLPPYAPSKSFSEAEFIRRIALAAAHPKELGKVRDVQAVLSEAIREHNGFLRPEFLRTDKSGYARRPFTLDPDGKFSVLVMTWDKGQGTPLHDHDGLWVVESLYAGKMQVTNYDYQGAEDGLHHFTPTYVAQTYPGEVEYRIPPAEHHLLTNALDTPSTTIHVFGGILESCHIFEPVKGGYIQKLKTMAYTPSGNC